MSETRFALNESQKGVWIECMENPQGTMYNIAVAVPLSERVDLKKLSTAFEKVVSVHPALFCTVGSKEGNPFLIQGNPVKDFVAFTKAESIQTAKKNFVRPFDLEKGPLFRAEICTAPDCSLLLFDIHHIVFDGTSLRLFLSQLGDAYAGRELPAEDMSLPEFVKLQEQQKLSEQYKKSQEYFKSRLDGVEFDCAPIPDRNSGARAGVVHYAAPASLDHAAVESFAHKAGVSENVLFMSAFAYALRCFSGNPDVCFTFASGGRGRNPRLDNTVGMFVRSLPLHIDCKDKQKVGELLLSVKEEMVGALKNECVSFGELSAEYGANTNVSFAYQAGIFDPVDLDGELLLPELLPNLDCQSDLIFMVIKTRSSYQASIYFRSNLYSDDLMRSLSQTVFCVTESLLRCDNTDEISFVQERDIIDKVNDTQEPIEKNDTVVSVFERTLSHNADRIAVQHEGYRCTFSEFDSITRKIASRIHELGIGRDEFVAVIVHRDEYMPIAAWGVIRSGAAFQPLDPTYPKERLEYMVADSKAPLVIAAPDLLPLIGEYKGKVILTDELQGLPDAQDLKSDIQPCDALTMIYTSGTTGKPKGCVLEHRNLVAFCANHTSIMGITNESRVASYASFGFDAGVMDVVTTIMMGAALCIIPDEIRLDLDRLESFFCDNSITHGFMTTQLGRMFAMQTKCKTLEGFLVGGEKLVPFTPSEGLRFVNGYGPCETMGYICSYRVTDNNPIQPIGKPSGNTKLYVTDSLTRLLPVGAVGELCISGLQVGRGYLGLPDKTAEVFVRNPFDGNLPGYERMYRTGDVVRLLPDGNFDFVGRRDSQVKVRGFRVELTEIEEVIRRFEGVVDATVAAFDDPAGGKFIAAYVTGDAPVDVNALNSFILNEKPSYMVPAVTIQLDAIPYNQNHKVNRRALPAPLPARGGAADIVAPEGDTECRIYDIAADVLGHKDFGATTDLFLAGLTSIGMLKLNSALAKAFGVPVKVSDFKANSCVRALGKLLCQAETKPTPKAPLMRDYPLMQNQMGVFVECGMDAVSLEYNVPVLMKVSDKIGPDALKAALCAAIDAHPYMKTYLESDPQGRIRAVRRDSAQSDADIIRCDALPDAFTLVKPFDVLGGQLYRAAVYVTKQGNYLFLDVHHIISDGTSIGILLSDVDAALRGEALQAEEFGGFEAALWEEETRSSAEYDKALQYYDSLLAGCNTNCLPAKCPAPSAKEGECAAADFSLGGESKQILDFCALKNISLNAFFNAAFSYVLGEFIHSSEVSYCTIFNGRSDSRLAQSFAMLVKTIPVCAVLKPESGIEDFILEIQNQLVSTMASDSVSFAELSRKYDIKPDIFFNYQGEDFQFDTLGGEKASLIPLELGVAKAPLSFEVFLQNGDFRFHVNYRKDILCSEAVESLCDAIKCAASGFARGGKLKDVSLISKAQMEYFQKMNSTCVPFENVPAQDFFEKQVALHPDRMAVVSAEGSLTYAQLDTMSNRVANALISKGLGNNEIIGIILERSFLVPVAELGILKAGCAFLPILPSYPKDRTDYCLKDASCRFVIDEGNVRELAAFEDDSKPKVSIDGSSLAYCIYTSGSTGTPKGVMVEQHNLSNFVQTAQIGQTQRLCSSILCMASISFDMSVTEIFTSLCQGLTLRIATEDEIHNPDKLLGAFDETGVDLMMATPSFAWSLLSMPQFERALSRLKAIVLGAEAFQNALFARLKSLNPDMLIQNGYGPTECTQVCSMKTLLSGENITIGSPFSNTKFYVMGESGNLLPRYAVGELIICGEGVCRGYVNLPEKNAATFFTLDGLRAYHSGDLVRVNRDNEVEFAGRRDNQVKLRGFRVELDEVESVMLEYEGVSRAKVIVRNNGTEDFLAGFYTADRKIEPEELSAFMKSKLTYYMVPAAMMQLDAMPMTPGGKLDKKALPEIRPVKKAKAGRAPKQSLEGKVVEIFKSVLNADECFVDDNFFEIGGTSLSASKVVMKLRSEGFKIEYQDIFDHQSAEELAEFLEGQRTASSDGSPAPAPSAEALYEMAPEIAKALESNSMAYASLVTREPLGDVLLTGSTGFLGCHVLKELLDSEKGHIYCLLRKGKFEDTKARLQSMLFYYFDCRFEEELSSRITVIEGDITDDALAQKLSGIHFDTLINCAACVKHFANDDSIEFVNVHGVQNLIAACRNAGARMIQISTTSVPGAHNEKTYNVHLKMTEDKLFVIDDMNNQYARSKYKAELLMLQAIRDGMRGKIVRVGNLMGRHKDGEFQINMRTNAFLNALRGFVAIGKCPISHSTDPMGFSPIDYTARAVVLLAGTNDCFTAFNADSRWTIDEMKVMEAVNRCGIKIDAVPDEEYYADFNAMMGDARKNEKISALLTNDRPDIHVVETDNRFTANILYRLGFSWPFVDDNYLEKTIQALDTLGFFIL